MYAADPSLHRLPYNVQQALFDEQYLTYTDAYSRHFETSGHTVTDLVFNVPQMRAAWARDHAMRSTGHPSASAFAFDAIERVRPDIIFTQKWGPFTASDLIRIRHDFPFVRTIATHAGNLKNIRTTAAFDVVFAAVPSFVEPLKRAGCENVHVVAHGFDSRILRALGPPPPEFHDVTFAGSVEAMHSRRRQILTGALDAGVLDCWINEVDPKARIERNAAGDRKRRYDWDAVQRRFRRRMRGLQGTVLAGQIGSHALGGRIDRIASKAHDSNLKYLSKRDLSDGYVADDAQADAMSQSMGDQWPDRVRPPVFGIDMYRLLRASRISLHCAANFAGESAGAIRLFEATGVGSLLLTDDTAGLDRYFHIDQEVVTYSGVGDCLEKIEWLIGHEKERQAIAFAGQERTLRDHTLASRAADIVQVLEQDL